MPVWQLDMKNQPDKYFLKYISIAAFQLTVFFIIGACIGWIEGLSASLLIQTIMATIMTAVASWVSISFTLKSNKRISQISPFPLMGILLGIAILAPIGIYFRANNIFGLDAKKQLNYWTPLISVSKDYKIYRDSLTSMKKSMDSLRGKAILKYISGDSLFQDKLRRESSAKLAQSLFEYEYSSNGYDSIEYKEMDSSKPTSKYRLIKIYHRKPASGLKTSLGNLFMGKQKMSLYMQISGYRSDLTCYNDINTLPELEALKPFTMQYAKRHKDLIGLRDTLHKLLITNKNELKIR